MILSSESRINKFDKRFEKISRKLLDKIDSVTYFKTFSKYQLLAMGKKTDKSLIVTTNDFCNISTRKTIVDTLQDADYKRGDAKWSEKVAIGFMDEVLNLYLFENDESVIEAVSKDISERYTVPVNRLKTQVALFLNNLDKGNDCFNILSYFSIYEIIIWKYRDINKLQKLVEDQKLPELDRQLLVELGMLAE